MNEFYKLKSFYRWFAAEEEARKLAQENPNIYVVVIFACCREIYMTEQHAGGVSKADVIEFLNKNKIAK